MKNKNECRDIAAPRAVGREFGRLYLDRGVQRVEAETEQGEGSELHRPDQLEGHDASANAAITPPPIMS